MVTRQMSQQYDNSPTTSPPFTSPQFESVRTVAGAILGRWPLLLMSMLTSLMLALLFLMIVTPRYISTAKILLDSQPKQVIDRPVMQSGLGSSAAGADTILVDTQGELIQSTAVLQRIIESEKLTTDAEFAVPHGGGVRMLLRNTLGRSLFGNERELPPNTNPTDIALWRFTDKHLRVRREGNTYTFSISVMSQDATKAARLANAVAQAYVKEGSQSATDTTRATTADLDARLADLRNRVQKAENEVEAWKTKNGLIGVPGLLLTEAQMGQLNDKLGLARAATAIAKARYDQVKDLSARSGGAALGAQSDALKSTVIANLRQSLSRLERQEAVIQQTLRPGHPDFAKAATEKRSVLIQLDEELSRIKANAKAEFELSQANERATADELKAAEGRLTSGNQAQVRLRELQRTFESERAVYQQFLNRANETREQADLSRPTSRIISPATVAPFPSFPPTMLTILGSLGGGLVLGAGLAWLLHLVNVAKSQHAPATNANRNSAGSSGAVWTDQTNNRNADVRIRRATSRLAHDTDGDDEPQHEPPRRAWPPRGMSTRIVTEPTAQNAAEAMVLEQPESAQTGANRLTARLRANAAATASLAAQTIRPIPAALPIRTAKSQPILRTDNDHRADPLTLPSPGSFARITFSDHLTAVEAARPSSRSAYRSAIDQLLATLAQSATPDVPFITLVAGTDVGVGASSTALSLAYRAANTGTRTLLIDACAADAHLSQRLARSLVQQRPCVLDSEEHLAEIAMQDSRTGLSLLPLAFSNLAHFNSNQQIRLLDGLRKLSTRYELVLIDVGAPSTNHGAVFLGKLAERLLIVTHDDVADPLLTAANFGVSAELATIVTTRTVEMGVAPAKNV
jgi:polysaccharide biosynthesis transport protein